MKKTITSLLTIILGAIITYAHFIKWIPFPMGNEFFDAANLVWAYTGLFIGVILIAIGMLRLIPEKWYDALLNKMIG